MRTSLNGILMDTANFMAAHRLNWVSIESVYLSNGGWVSVHVKSIEVLAEIAKRLGVTRKQIKIEPTPWNKNRLSVEFRARGIRWTCDTTAPQSQAELIGVDGEAITALPAPKRIGLPAPKRKPAALIPPSLFGGDA
jgi:hypothetical protein